MVGAKYPQEDAMSTDKIDNDTPFGTSHGPFLTGEFAPNSEELELTELPVEGKIPDDLNGVYLRNGPNPMFEPKAMYHIFDGDGMIHAGHFRNGQFTYRNKYVRTADLQKKIDAGEELFGA